MRSKHPATNTADLSGSDCALSIVFVVTLIAIALSVTACGRVMDKLGERYNWSLNQHNGKTLEELIAEIGPPTELSEKYAVWYSDERYSEAIRGHNGSFLGLRWYYRHCRFGATLDGGRIVASEHAVYAPTSRGWNGNACNRYAPPPPLFGPIPPE